ncbi:hypothetical protein UF75_1290 [Desulfosporosinus sp. I2]|nr:hypothetical protein UF75_1290 [Desulfosporosinus sp. I2]
MTIMDNQHPFYNTDDLEVNRSKGFSIPPEALAQFNYLVILPQVD